MVVASFKFLGKFLSVAKEEGSLQWSSKNQICTARSLSIEWNKSGLNGTCL